jgi:hypothetical protein
MQNPSGQEYNYPPHGGGFCGLFPELAHRPHRGQGQQMQNPSWRITKPGSYLRGTDYDLEVKKY